MSRGVTVWSRRILQGVAAVAIGAGLAALAGWRLHNLPLVQPFGGWMPMQYNGGLMLVACGLGLLALVRGRERLAVAAGAFTTALSVLVLFEYVTGVNVGIDTLLVEPFTTAGVSHPGRLSPNAALGFALIGAASWLSANRRCSLRPLLVGMLASVAIALASVSALGHLLDVSQLYGWAYHTRMAAQTALALVAIGTALIVQVRQSVGEEYREAFSWRPLIGAVGVLSATVLLWVALVRQENEYIEHAVQGAAESVKYELARHVEPAVLALTRLALRWEYFGRPSHDRWALDALLNVRHYPGFRSIQWVDPGLRPRWAWPDSDNEQQYVAALIGPAERTRVEEARAHNAVALLYLPGPDHLLQAFVPVNEPGRFAGYISGVLDVQQLFDTILEAHAAKYGVMVMLAGEPIYERNGVAAFEAAWGRELGLDLHGLHLGVRVWPQRATLAEMRSPIPWIVLVSGLVLATLLLWALQLLGTSRARAGQVARANRVLTAEIEVRRQTEAELKTSQARYRSLVDSIRDAIVVADRSHRIIACNPAFTHLFGYLLEEVRGRPSGVIYRDPRDSAELERLLRETGRTAYIKTVTYRKKAGELFPGETGMFYLRDGDQRVTGYIKLIRDVTERERASLEIKRQTGYAHLLHQVASAANRAGTIEEAARTVIDLVCAAVHWPVGHLYLVDPGRERLVPTGIGHLADAERFVRLKEALAGRDLTVGEALPARVLRMGHPQWALDLMQPPVLPCSEAALSAGLSAAFAFPVLVETEVTGVLEFFGLETMRPDDPLLDTLAQVGTHLGRTIERVRSRDKIERLNQELEHRVTERTAQLAEINAELELEIAERQRAEESLAAESGRLAVTLQSIGDGVITTDMAGQVVLINTVAEQLTGWPVAAAVGRPLQEVLHQEVEGDSVPARVMRLIESGSAEDFGRRSVLVSRDGARRIISDSGAPIRDSTGCVIGAVVVFRDVTERVRMEEDLIKAQKLESIGLLAGGIAHDFNNILTAILGNISLARMYAQEGSQVHTVLGEAEKAFWRARSLTQQLLTFARGGAPIRKTGPIAELLVDTVSFALRGTNARCELDVAPDLEPVRHDAGQMSQVFNNLVINATQAMPQGGIIAVSARNISLREGQIATLPAGRYVCVTIADQGVGIAEEHLPKIFDPYFTTKTRGTGLGLATAYSIIKRHDGHIAVDSRPAHGARFHVYLPVSKETGGAVPRVAAGETRPGQGRILVMDDEQPVREVAAKLLAALGYDVSEAESGEAALELYREALQSPQPFDAVILDLTVPGAMGGKECVQRLREIDPGVRAIVSSGYSNDPVMSEFLTHGFRAIMSKPYQMHELADTLSQVLRD